MKRYLAFLVVAGAIAAGAGIAWAHPSGEGGSADGPRREAIRTCVREAREANPDTDRAELKEAVMSCLEAKGITPRQPTPERRERRAEFRECVDKARAAHPGADRALSVKRSRSV